MTQFPQLSFAGMQDYAPYEGGGHGFIPQEGLYKVKIDAAEPGLAKDGVKGMVKVGAVVQDQDVGGGTHLISRVLYSGTDKNGKPLVRQFCDFLVSTGTPSDNIKQFGAQGAAMPIEQAIGQLVGRDAYVEIKFGTYNGQLTTEIANWVTPERYAKAVESGAHRGRKAEHVNPAALGGGAATAPAGAPAIGGVNLGGPAAAPAGNAQVAVVAPAGGAQPTIPNL